MNTWAFPSGRAFATRFPAEKAGRAQTMAQSLTQKARKSVLTNEQKQSIHRYRIIYFHTPGVNASFQVTDFFEAIGL